MSVWLTVLIGSLESVASGGAPVAVINKFKRRFPNVSFLQSYGLTETRGEIARGASPCESMIPGTLGRLIANCEAKIVDPNTAVSLPPMNHGELLGMLMIKKLSLQWWTQKDGSKQAIFVTLTMKASYLL
ncbi:4-coumarate-coa ligase [Artemisia annua]|uniref:4-coumarate-coa ligase n=1 Tax=Artemisia annua TaxID=35608 RepID=A0A2U1KFZ4_ARTAN|nr:4-coumarate-coa ligase [Artemisia annua]